MSLVANDKIEVNKDQTNFLHLCKDLFKFIKKKIIKNYVCEDFQNSLIPLSETWSYNHPEEELTQKDKSLNIFKDNTFLPLVQKCYEALEAVITRMDENRKNIEAMKKEVENDMKKMKLLTELKSQLNKYFNNGDKNSNNNTNCGEANKLLEQLSLAKSFNILNDLQNMNNESAKENNNNKDNSVPKCDNISNIIDNNDLTGDYSDETKSFDKLTFIGHKRDLSFDSILSSDKINNTKKSNFENISFMNKNSNCPIITNNIIVPKNKETQDKPQLSQSQSELEKILKWEFSSIYSSSQKDNLSGKSKDYVIEIKNILNRISSINFPQAKNKFENPVLVGSHKLFDIKYLLNSIPAIDILFKCREIKNMEEIESISKETMNNKLKLSYIEICKVYDKSSEVIKVTNKCKIDLKNNIFFIYINLFFVDVQNSNYIKKEKCFLNYASKNKMYENNDMILISLFFRRWRRKFKLYFIKPEFIDIIINLYYKHIEKKSIAHIIENIFFDLSNNKINYFEIKGNGLFCSFISEWYNNNENKKAINNAMNITNEYLLKNDYLSLVKFD